jgi:two-component system, chemotaxis family, chemotaxis protein CheY
MKTSTAVLAAKAKLNSCDRSMLVKKILIVDDSATARMLLRKDLEAGGYFVIEGQDGAQGLDALNRHPDTSLIICDVSMPVMDGLKMSKYVRSKFKDIPIFILTTESNPETKDKAKEFGVLAWISKPYVANKLLSAVAKVLK